MAFNRKENEIQALGRANEFLQGEVSRMQEEQQQLGPYYQVARDLYDGVQDEVARTDDPAIAYDPDQIYARVYETVRGKLIVERREALRQRIIAEKRPEWEKEIDDEIAEAEGAAIEAEVRQNFLANEADSYRERAEPRIGAEIARIKHEDLIAGLDEETRARLYEQAQEKALRDEEYKQRLNEIRDISARHGQLDLNCLAEGEVFTIDFCARGEAKDDMPEKRQNGYHLAAVERTLKLTVIDAQTGLVLVLDDSWQKDEDDLRAEHALDDNTQIVIGRVQLLPGDRDIAITPSIHRGGLLFMNHDGLEVINPFEVSRVWLKDDCIL